MTRRLNLAIFFLIFSATTAWPKMDKEDRAYLVEQFRALQDQIQALKTRVETPNTQLTEMRQTHAQLQTVIIRQQRALQDIEQLVSSIRLTNEDSFSNLKSTLGQLRTEQQKAFSSLTGQPALQATGPAETSPPPRQVPGLPVTPPGVQGYITDVEGNNVKVDLGSGQGLRPGSHLAVYKSTDQNTRVGVLEVTQVTGAGESRARVMTMNPGVRPEFSDIVRVE